MPGGSLTLSHMTDGQKSSRRDPRRRCQLENLIEDNGRLQREVALYAASEQTWKDERALLLALINQVPDYLFIKDLNGRFILANSAVAADLNQASPERLIGKSDFELHPPEVAEHFFADDQHVMRSGKPKLDIEEFIIDVSGEKKWLSTSKVPLCDQRDEIIGIVGVARDVTRRKKAEDENQLMLARLHAAQDQLTRAVAAAEESNQAKSSFLANMSHEIRTPLNGVLGMAQSLRDDTLSPVQREKVAIILDSGNTLMAVLNDILDLSKIEAGKLEISPSMK